MFGKNIYILGKLSCYAGCALLIATYLMENSMQKRTAAIASSSLMSTGLAMSTNNKTIVTVSATAAVFVPLFFLAAYNDPTP